VPHAEISVPGLILIGRFWVTPEDKRVEGNPKEAKTLIFTWVRIARSRPGAF